MDLKELKIKKEKETKETGRFVIEPLPAGYGATLGTALRRVLLSSLPGGAVTEMRIQGVSHPFTTIKGVKEDVVELMLNLKKVRFKLHGDGPFEGTLEAKGKKVLKAGDIKISSEAVVANPDFKVATLTDRNTKLSISLLVERGIGYRSVEDREGGKVGAIPLDSIFSPVTKVVLSVEGTRMGRRTDLDRLVLEVTTDGTLKPSEAIEESAKILHGYFARIAGWEKQLPTEGEKEDVEKTESSLPKAGDKVRKTPTSDLGLPPRVLNTIEGAGIRTIGGLLQKSEEDLLGIQGFGESGLSKIKKALKKLGASLKEG